MRDYDARNNYNDSIANNNHNHNDSSGNDKEGGLPKTAHWVFFQ